MPEGHSIHILAADHTELLTGQKVRASSPQGRFRDGAKLLDGKKLRGIEPIGKHLFYDFADGQCLHVHLGRYGKMKLFKGPPQQPQGQIRLRLHCKQGGFDLSGPTACELLDRTQRQGIFDRLGPDPLRGDSPQVAREKTQRSRREIGAILLDQSIFAGVGNIFRAEVLHALKVDPRLRGTDVSDETFDSIWKMTTRHMKQAVKLRRIVTVTRKEAGMPLSKVSGLQRFRCYKQEFCPDCEARILRWEQGARTMYACPSCQNMD